MKIELPDQKKLVHECVIPIRWGDMDAYQHVNNTTYFRYMETARCDWLGSVGLPVGVGDDGPVIVSAFCNFLQALVYPGDALVKTYVSDIGRATFETWVTIERTDEPGVLYATAGATVVWIDLRANKAISLPDHVRALLA